MKYLVLLFVCLLSVSVFGKKECIKNSHPAPAGVDACYCDEGYVSNPQGNVCCGPNTVWQQNKCNACVKNAHPKIQKMKMNGIDTAVSCDCNEGFVMNKAGNKCSPKK
ncbi:MAG: hypothetical protein WCQ53_06855 [bacterium]